ncbi:MAG: ankyrin repeat domain-containing protein [Candidatus Thiothrix singaporensis]|uniref:Ankyrin repeat domain-containing protein n=1 Tax=Candidatus Thiothrix singaporensis TaxID=2799669 RepID=A0A7L6AU89_9GAMM|nr:MAG: ankyrin repeat domain-containing protein [Candidatus Thiothrix singaporensis]
MKTTIKKPDILQEYALLPEYSDKFPSIDGKNLFGDYPLNTASIIGDVKDVQEIINLGSNINCQGEDGYTPLHNAVEQGNIEVLKLLLSLGADANIKDDDGCTPLDLAIILQKKQAIKLLSP